MTQEEPIRLEERHRNKSKSMLPQGLVIVCRCAPHFAFAQEVLEQRLPKSSELKVNKWVSNIFQLSSLKPFQRLHPTVDGKVAFGSGGKGKWSSWQ